jgi:integration host factor beta subunit
VHPQFEDFSMTKNELIKGLRQTLHDYPAKDIAYAVHVIFDAMTDALVRGERIEIRGFGNFTVRHRPPRQARNPKNGVAVPLDARRTPFFKVGKDLQRRINPS